MTNFAVPFDWFGLLRFSLSGHYLIATTVRNNRAIAVRVWATGDWCEAPLVGAQGAGLWSVDLSPDDRLLAAAYFDSDVKLFRFPSGQYEGTFTNHTGYAGPLFSANGRFLVAPSLDGATRVWEVPPGRNWRSCEAIPAECGVWPYHRMLAGWPLAARAPETR